MKAPSKKKMIAFRPMPGDQEKLAKLVLVFGGLSESETIRIAINEAVNGEKRPAIYPQLPPIKEVELGVAALKKIVRIFEDNRRNFWPQHIVGESVERTAAVRKARQDSDAALKEFRPQLDYMRGLLAAMNVAKVLDSGNLKAVMDAAKQLEKSNAASLSRSKDQRESEEIRKKAEYSVKFFAPLVDFVSRVGLLGPPTAAANVDPKASPSPSKDIKPAGETLRSRPSVPVQQTGRDPIVAAQVFRQREI